MLAQKRLQSLQSKKELLASRIEQAERAPSIDATTLRQLKKQKLELQDIIQGIRADSKTIH